jgi:hypothetical protein
VEEESLASKKDEEGTADRLKQIDKERTALQAEQNRLAEDAVRAAETAFNQKKAELDVANRLTGALMEQSKIQESMEVLQDKKELREAKRGFAFDFIDQGRLELQQKIEAAQRALSADELKNQADINKGKKAIISAEYVLLRARLEAAATEAASRAGGANEAARLRGLAGTLSESERVALSNIDSGEIARQGGLKETLENLKEANNELSSMEQITNSLETSITSGLTTALDGLIQGTMSVKEAFASMAQGILRALSQVIAELIAIQILKSIISGFSVSAGSAQALALQPQLPGLGSQALAASAPNITARNGGMFEKAPGYATGGIARGREAGYPAILHGTEAVVPLPNGKSIPVEMQKGGQQMNNVTVNVSMDGGGNGQQTSQSSGQQGASLGAAIATAVQKELQNQKRSGGILNPYGVA